MLLFSCTSINNEEPNSLSFVTRRTTFTASREGLFSNTKTTILDDGTVRWKPAEEISVFFNNDSNGGVKFVSDNDTVSGLVDFVGDIPNAENEYWAVYPFSVYNAFDGNSITVEIPSVQEAIDGNLPENSFPTIARTTTKELVFMNVCGGLMLQVSTNDIKSITIKGNCGETIAGIVKVSFGDRNEPEVTDVIFPEKEITLIAPEGTTFKPGKFYYCSLLPSVFPSGVTITMRTDSSEGQFTSGKAQVASRSVLGVLNNVDSKLDSWGALIEEDNTAPRIVDMGLSIKWGAYNVGAARPEQMGSAFAWGEVETKNKYDWSTYKWSNGNTSKITKYNSTSVNGYNGFTDNDIYLNKEDDAAYAFFGDNWRMPSKREWEELLKCVWEWTSLHGVHGYKVTSKTTNDWLFFPVDGEEGEYWSDELSASSKAYFLRISDIEKNVDSDYRYIPRLIRPVFSEKMPEEILLRIVLNVGEEVEMYSKYTKRLVCVFSPSTAKCPIIWSSDNEAVASVDQEGLVTGLSAGVATITVTTEDCAFSAKCKVTVMPFEDSFVDFGVSVKWSRYNLGSDGNTSPGTYYAWGEAAPKESYEPGTYPLSWSIKNDPAHIAFGSKCRVPTRDEFLELLSHTDQKWTTILGRNGVKIYLPGQTSGDFIFLPAGGYYNGTTKKDNNKCWYWTKTTTRLSTDAYDTKTAWSYNAYLTSGDDLLTLWQTQIRGYGLPIRFVYDPSMDD